MDCIIRDSKTVKILKDKILYRSVTSLGIAQSWTKNKIFLIYENHLFIDVGTSGSHCSVTQQHL